MSEIVFFGHDMLSVSLIINLVFPFLKINPILISQVTKGVSCLLISQKLFVFSCRYLFAIECWTG